MADDDKTPKVGPMHVTVDGVKLTVDPNVFNDWDVARLLWQITAPNNSTDSNPFAIVPVFEKICGKDYPRVIDALRKQGNGHVTDDAVVNFLNKLMRRVVPNP